MCIKKEIKMNMSYNFQHVKDKKDFFRMSLKNLNYNFRYIFHKCLHFQNISSNSHRYISSRMYYFLINSLEYIRSISHPKSRKGINQSIFCRFHYSCKNHQRIRYTSKDCFMYKHCIQSYIGNIDQLIKEQNLNNSWYNSQYYMSDNFKHPH